MINWIKRLISGWIPTSGEKFGKILWVIGIILMVSLSTNLWTKFFPQKPSTSIGTVGTYYAEPKDDVIRFGCNLWRAYGRIGVRQ